MRPAINKVSKPIVFVDSCIAINLIKTAFGKKGADLRFQRLLEIMCQRISEKKIIVPYGAIDDEIAGTEAKINNARFMFLLSRGFKWKSPSLVKALEKKKAFECFKKSEMPSYSIDDALDFKSDPSVFESWINSSELLKKLSEKKKNKTEALNKLKQTSPETSNYEIARFRERTYELGLLMQLYEKRKKDQPFDERDNKFLKREVLYLEPGDLNKPDTFIILNKFFSSNQFQEMPWINIEREILAHEMAKCNSFRDGDSTDLNYAAAYLPFCSFFLTDNDMATKLRKLKFDDRFLCKIYSSTNIEDFEKELGCL